VRHRRRDILDGAAAGRRGAGRRDRDAVVRASLNERAPELGLEPIDSYLLLSLVGELRISEIVDAPNWVVSMHIPASYLRLG
jgi:hypothetical protein